MNPPPFDVVIAHGPCDDGFTAAWIYWRTLPVAVRMEVARVAKAYNKNKYGEDHAGIYDQVRDSSALTSHDDARGIQEAGAPVVFAFMHPESMARPDLVIGRRVLVLDLDLGNNLAFVATVAARVLLIDHHKSSQRGIDLARVHQGLELEYATSPIYSGASLTWKYFNAGTPALPLVEAVRVYDTWTFDSSSMNVRAIKAALHVNGVFTSFNTLSRAVAEWDEVALTRAGELYDLHTRHVVSGIVKRARMTRVRLSGGRSMRALAVVSNVFMNAVGEALKDSMRDADFCAVMNPDAGRDVVGVSLRSPAPGVDLSEVARDIEGQGKVGGGGHAAAAGFHIAGIRHLTDVFVRDE